MDGLSPWDEGPAIFVQGNDSFPSASLNGVKPGVNVGIHQVGTASPREGGMGTTGRATASPRGGATFSMGPAPYSPLARPPLPPRAPLPTIATSSLHPDSFQIISDAAAASRPGTVDSVASSTDTFMLAAPTPLSNSPSPVPPLFGGFASAEGAAAGSCNSPLPIPQPQQRLLPSLLPQAAQGNLSSPSPRGNVHPAISLKEGEADSEAPLDVMFVGRRRPPRPGMNSSLASRGGVGETLEPLPQGAFLTGVSLLGGESSGRLSPATLSSSTRPPSGGMSGPPPPPPPPPSGDLDPHLQLDQESRAELEALRSMWCSDPYSGGNDGVAAESALLVRNLITQAEEDEWRQYEAGAEKFAEELVASLARQDEARQGRRQPLGAGARMRRNPGGALPSARPTKQMMETLSVVEGKIAASLDPERLTGLNLDSYDDSLHDLMSRLMVAPMATRYLFYNKVQGLVSLGKRAVEDRELARQLGDLVWSAGLGMEDLQRGGPGGRMARGTLPSSQQQQQQLQLSRGGSGLPFPLPTLVEEASVPLVFARILPKPREISPQRHQQQHQQHKAAAATAAPPSWVSPSPVVQLSASDQARYDAELRRHALESRLEGLFETRRQMSEAVAQATEAFSSPGGGGGAFYDSAPTPEEEAQVIESLAKVTVALHAGLLRRARGREELMVPGGGRSVGVGVMPWGAPPPVPSASSSGAAAAGSGGGGGGMFYARDLSPGRGGVGRPHAMVSSVKELTRLTAGLSGAVAAAASLRDPSSSTSKPTRPSPMAPAPFA